MDQITDTMNTFTSPAEVNTTDSGFLNSNGIVAKIVFLILVIVIFLVLFFLIVKLIGYFSAPSAFPMLVNGQIQGSQTKQIVQNPADSSSKLIARSNNQTTGIEFTWSVWLNFQGSTSTTQYSPAFVKGDVSKPSNSPYCSINHGPGVYFGMKGTQSENQLFILMDTIDTPATQNPELVINVSNGIITDNYFHLAIRCQSTYIDIYINGNIIIRKNLPNVPKQNYYDVVACPSPGFNGLLSNLQYFNKALSVIEINRIVQSGPNTSLLNQKAFNPSSINAISTSWFSSFIH